MRRRPLKSVGLIRSVTLKAALAFVALPLGACGEEIPSCNADQVVAMADKMWRDNLSKSDLAKEIVDISKSRLILENVETIKNDDEIRECSAYTFAKISLTSAGQSYERGGGILPTAFISALRKPYDMRYVIRMNDDRKSFTAEFFGSTK